MVNCFNDFNDIAAGESLSLSSLSLYMYCQKTTVKQTQRTIQHKSFNRIHRYIRHQSVIHCNSYILVYRAIDGMATIVLDMWRETLFNPVRGPVILYSMFLGDSHLIVKGDYRLLCTWIR